MNEGIQKRLARRANRALSRFGVSLVRSERVANRMEDAVRRLRANGIRPATVIDVGAALGDWSAMSRRIFPEARHVLVEPLQEFELVLRARLSAELSGSVYVPAAAASSDAPVDFKVHEDLSGSSRFDEAGVDSACIRVVEGIRLDRVVDEHDAPPPYLLKLDVQGAELDVLQGASSLLEDAEAVILETLFFNFLEGAPIFHEVVATMAQRGFVVYDLVDPSRRPLDDALGQVDLVFVPEDGRLRTRHEYASPDQRRELDASFRARYRARGISSFPSPPRAERE